MSRIILLIAFSIMAASLSFAQEKTEAKERYNKVSYGEIKTGRTISSVMTEQAPYKKGESASWTDFTSTEPEERIWAPAPEDMSVSRSVASHITITTARTQAPRCGEASRMLFVSSPADGPNGRLYAYEFVACDTTGLLTPQIMLDQYIAKYGMYDKKDYDLDMIIYNNVHGRYRVGVRPFTSQDNRAGIVITVVDDDVYRDVYEKTLSSLRKAFETVKALL